MSETCGCYRGREAPTANRPGLDALTYRAGTHGTFLDAMKARLSAAEHPALGALTTRASSDASIALLDAWATVADVLTFYAERIANEGYLRTATERLSVLELARLVGYAPRPGVAASVYLAFTLEGNDRTAVPAGTRAQSLPGPGELPQFFETAEELEASPRWNVLAPRQGRPQTSRPAPSSGEGPPPGRLYIKGVTTNLAPNDPLLVDLGGRQFFLRVITAEPDPDKDRTLVTLTPPVASRPAAPTERPGATERIGEIRHRLEGYLDLRANEVPPGETTGRVVELLEGWRADLTPETPPERLAASLRDRVLPRIRQDLSTARDRNYTRLLPWLESVEGGLREVEGELSEAAYAEPAAPRAPAAILGTTAAAPVENGRPASRTLEGLLDLLAKPPSVQPTDASRLPRRLEKSFGADSDAVPRLLTTLRPELGDALYRAWEQTGAEPGGVRVYALRVTAAPFGHNAPQRPILEEGRIARYEEWTLDRLSPTLRRPFEVTVTTNNDWGHIYGYVSVSSGAASNGTSFDLQEELRFELTLQEDDETGETVETVTGVFSSVEGFSFTLTLTFQRSRMELSIRTAAGGTEYEQTRLDVRIQANGDFEVINGESYYTVLAPLAEVTLDLDEPPSRTEDPHAVSLDASYKKQILPESWVVVERPFGAGDVPETVIARAGAIREASRADYGMAGQGTRISLPEGEPWLDLGRDDFSVIRGTSVHAGSELLELAEAPPEVVGEDGSVKLEPVEGGRIELDALYDGLEPGRWLFVSGERDDLPGAKASELVMLAGVEQGVGQAEIPAGDLGRVGVGQEIRLSGRGSTGPGGLDLTVSARLLPDGSATGYAHLVGGATGDVVGVEPPGGERDFWCVNVRRTDTAPRSGDQRTNFYVRDVGDGRTTFDQISAVSGIGLDCDGSPGAWLPLVEGGFRATIDQPDEKVHSTLVLANDLAYPYKRETVKIYGNVVRATHGETRPEVLGSGDGGVGFQRFVLKQSPLTHVAATTPDGVRSTLEVYVNDVRWHEAEHLAGLGPTDRRFVTQTDDGGEVSVVFGDGRRGARLPTGAENVRAIYRTGIGRIGNVTAEQIGQLATSPLGLKGVINPLPATGGADRETREGARRNAPLGVKVFDRLVSVRDYEDFARAFAGIGKASATRLSDGRRQVVHLTVAGADDIPIAGDSDVYRHLLAALGRFGDPQQPLRVEVRELLLLIIGAGVRLLPDYLWASVEPKIRATLLDTFGFERRGLGQDAHLSEAIGAIQRVPGVAYVDIDTFGGISEKTADPATNLRRPLLPHEVGAEITRLVRGEGQPAGRVAVAPASSKGASVRPAQLAFLTPRVPDTLILKEITS